MATTDRGSSEDVIHLETTDGSRLSATLFRAPRRPGERGGDERAAAPALVIASATGVPRSYYRRYASYVAARGVSVLTFDYRGIGGSKPASLRGFGASLRDWGERDLAAALDYAKGPLAATRVGLIGHSFGGQALGLVPNIDLVDAFLGVGVALGDLDLYPAPHRHAYRALMAGAIPLTTTALGFWPMRIVGGEDLPGGVARQWARWCRKPGYYTHRPGVKERLAAFRGPTRLYSFDDDTYAPRRAADAFAALFRSTDVDRRHLDPVAYGGRLGHFSFFRPRFESSLWAESLRFFEGALAPGALVSVARPSLDEYLFDPSLRRLAAG